MLRLLRTIISRDPEAAVELVAGLDAMLDQDGAVPVFLVTELAAAGHHEQAAGVALAQSDPGRATPLVTAAFKAWAAREPEVALDFALGLDDAKLRLDASRAAISGWARAAPDQLAAFAAALPRGPEQEFALLAALRAWQERDAAAAAAWMARHESLLTASDRLKANLTD